MLYSPPRDTPCFLNDWSRGKSGLNQNFVQHLEEEAQASWNVFLGDLTSPLNVARRTQGSTANRSDGSFASKTFETAL